MSSCSGGPSPCRAHCALAVSLRAVLTAVLLLLVSARSVDAIDWPSGTRDCCKASLTGDACWATTVCTLNGGTYDCGFLCCADAPAGWKAVNSFCPAICANGYYQPDRKQTTCLTCSAGYFSGNAPATGCTQCGAGSWSGAAASSCTPCSSGRWGTATVQASEAAACPNQCVAGYRRTASTGCTTQACACAECPFGTYTTTGMATTCTPVPAGYRANAAIRATGVSKCPLHSFSAGNTDTCTPCGAGLRTLSDGATSAAACVVCAAGTRGVGTGLGCTPCDAGSFLPLTTAATTPLQCTPASAGHFVPLRGSARETRAGYGFFVIGEGAVQREECAQGHTTDQPTSVSSAQCFPCPRATFLYIDDDTTADTDRVCRKCRPDESTLGDASVGAQSCRPCREVGAPGCTRSLSLTDTGSSTATSSASASPSSAGSASPSQSRTRPTDSLSASHELTNFTESAASPSASDTPSETIKYTRSSQTLSPTDTAQSDSGSAPLSNTTTASQSESASLSPSRSGASPTDDHNTSTVSDTPSVSRGTDSVSRHRNSTTVSQTNSGETNSRGGGGGGATISDSVSRSARSASVSVDFSASASVAPSNGTVTDTQATPTRSDPQTVSDTVSLPVLPPPTMGLSAETALALSRGQQVLSALMSAAAAPAALTLMRGTAALSLIGCPERNPADGKRWSDAAVPFPASLIPGAQSGEGAGRFNRASVISFVVAIGLIVGIGLLTSELLGRLTGDNDDGDSSNNRGGGLVKQDSMRTLQTLATKREERLAAAKKKRQQEGASTSDSSPPSSSSACCQRAKKLKRGVSRLLLLDAATPREEEDGADKNVDGDGGSPTAVTTTAELSASSSASSSSSTAGSTPKRKPASRWPMMVYIVVNGSLGIFAPQAGLTLATWLPGDICLAVLPLVFIFGLHIYMSAKLVKSINSDSGILYAPSTIVEAKGSPVAARDRWRSARCVLESKLGRFALLGDRFWTRLRGSRGEEAQDLLDALGGQLQRFRGPEIDVDFLDSAHPFLDAVRSHQPLDEDVLRGHFDNVEHPTLLRRAAPLSARISPHFLLIAWAESAVVGLATGVGLAHTDLCPAMARLICGVNIASTLLSLWLRPHVVPLKNWVVSVLDFVVSACSLVAAILLVKMDVHNHGMMMLAAALQLTVAVVGGVAGGILIITSAMRGVILFVMRARVASTEESWAAQQFYMSRTDELELRASASAAFSPPPSPTSRRRHGNNSNGDGDGCGTSPRTIEMFSSSSNNIASLIGDGDGEVSLLQRDNDFMKDLLMRDSQQQEALRQQALRKLEVRAKMAQQQRASASASALAAQPP